MEILLTFSAIPFFIKEKVLGCYALPLASFAGLGVLQKTLVPLAYTHQFQINKIGSQGA